AYLRVELRIEEKKWTDALTILTREDTIIAFIVKIAVHLHYSYYALCSSPILILNVTTLFIVLAIALLTRNEIPPFSTIIMLT
ncbi:MAG TPA: hypothetical protein VHG34_03880, partial [Nitrososphaeraceae archaeon]|nr:hypothetical protein [Nitrososphaeraceae archaeon]